MQRKLLARLLSGIVRSMLILMAILTADFLLFIFLIRRMQRDKQLRTKVVRRLNAVILPLAGRRFAPFGLLRHIGRRSGRAYMTPLRAYPFGDGFLLGLTYGPETDWCRNVMAAGEGILRWRGQEYLVGKPEIVSAVTVLGAYPLPIRWAMQGGFIKQCLWLHRLGEEPVTKEAISWESVSIS